MNDGPNRFTWAALRYDLRNGIGARDSATEREQTIEVKLRNSGRELVRGTFDVVNVQVVKWYKAFHQNSTAV
jgi:hypothetical protein